MAGLPRKKQMKTTDLQAITGLSSCARKTTSIFMYKPEVSFYNIFSKNMKLFQQARSEARPWLRGTLVWDSAAISMFL